MRLLICTLLFVVCASFSVMAQTQINVGLTAIHPPFVINDEDRQGVVYDVIDALNNHQNQYEFVSVLYPVRRLLADYNEANIHVVAYNNVNWGWAKHGGVGSVYLTKGRDLFVSLATPKVDKKSLKEIGAVRGFHYAFAGFDADKLSAMRNVSLVADEENVLRLVEFNRVVKGVVSEAILNWIATSDPKRFQKFNIDVDNPDHSYNRQLITLKNSPITINEVNKLLKELCVNGVLQKIYDKYGLTVPVF